MAGIWERVKQASDPDFARLNVSLLETELTGFALGIRTKENARANLEAELGEALNAAELTDLNAIADQFNSGSIETRLVYAHRVKFALNAAELGLITEAEFRNALLI